MSKNKIGVCGVSNKR